MDSRFDDKAPLSRSGIAAGFMMLFGEILFVNGLCVLVGDRKVAVGLGLLVVGGLLTWRCFEYACTPAAYRQ
jgi:hypothetical protein